MASARSFFQSPAGKVVAGVVAVVGVAGAIWAITSVFGQTEADYLTTNRIFVCSETGKGFPYEVQVGDTIPVDSPHSGKKTGYPAELCYWTKDGGTKPEATAVLMNGAVGKPGQTFCPDCGRLVVLYNPRPVAGGKPPPTKEEAEKLRSTRRQQE